MTIDLDEQEYRTLLEVLFLAHWVLEAHALEEQPETARFAAIEQKVLARADDFGSGDAAEFDEETGRYYPTKEFEETSGCFERIEDFEDDTFWDELVTRLAERDVLRDLGEDRFIAMSVEDRMEAVAKAEERYAAEFEANGLENITIRQ